MSLENLVLLNPDLAPLQKEFSVCGWFKYYRVDGNRYWFSYAVPGHNNMLVIKAGSAHFGDVAVTKVDSLEERQIYLHEWINECVTWSSASQLVRLYYNGVLAAEDVKDADTRLTPGGTLILGQEQDSVGGGFTINQSFGGEIYGLQMFNRALTTHEVRTVYEAGLCVSSASLPNTYLAWGDFLAGERRGEVEVVEVGCSVWDLLVGFQGVEIGKELIASLKRSFY